MDNDCQFTPHHDFLKRIAKHPDHEFDGAGFTVHMIVKDEDQWIWYAIASVIDKAKELLIYDTGSQDKTVGLIKSFKSQKIIFTEKGPVSPEQLVDLRNEQIKRTKTEWFLLVDGDEVWSQRPLNSFIKTIAETDQKTIGIVARARVCLGDIYHYQDENAGKYNISGRVGHLNIRGYRKTEEFSWAGIYPDEVYLDQHNNPLQNQQEKLIFLDDYYWHLTHLQRSSTSSNSKRKFELGNKIKINYLPEVFFSKRPKFVPDPWRSYNFREYLLARVITPFKKIKRMISH